MQFLSYNRRVVPCCRLKFFVYFKVTQYIQRTWSGRLQEVKNNRKLVITKGCGVQSQNAFAPFLRFALVTRVIKLRAIEGPNARDQIVLCVFHSFLVKSRWSPNECWLQTCDACVITTRRLGLRAPLVTQNYYCNRPPRKVFAVACWW